MIKSGVYKIQSKIKPERIYIGSAVNLSRRKGIHVHLLRKNEHHSSKLQNHFNKYGEGDLIFSTICECERDELIITEQYLIDFYRPWFNTRIIADSQLGVKRSEETKQKLRGHPVSEETRRKISIAHKGKRLSEEHKRKMSECRKGVKQSPEVIKKRADAHRGFRHSEEAKRKMSESGKGKNMSPEFCEMRRVMMTGTKRSEETKQKMRGRKMSEEEKEKRRGKVPWNKGKKASPELKLKLSESHKGKKQSVETIEKRRQKMVGRKRSAEVRLKLSNALKGNANGLGNKSKTGQKLSEEHKKKLNEGNRRYREQKRKLNDKGRDSECSAESATEDR